MKQNTILPTLIQKLIFDDSHLDRLKALLGYGDTARKCTAEAAALYLISAALYEWKSFLHCADAGVQSGLPQVERSTLSTDKRFVLVSDRAYFKIHRIDQFVSDKQDFVIRIKENVELSTIRSLQRQNQAGSRVTRDITCRLGTPQSRSEIRHRVVFFQDDHGHEIRVVTSLMSVSAEEVAEMYKARWAIESFFRWIKQNLNVPVLFDTTPNAVFNQLYAALIAYAAQMAV